MYSNNSIIAFALLQSTTATLDELQYKEILVTIRNKLRKSLILCKISICLPYVNRCSYVRLGNSREQLTDAMKKSIIEKVLDYGTGRDTLRCLALATADDPMDKDDMNLTDSTKFASYEVSFVEIYDSGVVL